MFFQSAKKRIFYERLMNCRCIIFVAGMSEPEFIELENLYF